MSDDRETRLARARAELAELEAARVEREAALSEQEELESAERAVRDAKALAAAEKEHGRAGKSLAAVETPRGLVIVKRAAPIVFRRFQDQGKYESDALRDLVKPCVVYPDKGAFDQLLEEFPGLLVPLSNAVCELAGVRAKEVSGK